LTCVAVTPRPSAVSFGTLVVVAPPAGRGDDAAFFALLLHAAATTTSPTSATRRIRWVARATSLRKRLPVC
jgi:hypothetical protein